MKKVMLAFMGLALSGCALAGVYGPEAQERARASLAQIGNSLDAAGAAYCNGVAAAEAGRAQAYANCNTDWQARTEAMRLDDQLRNIQQSQQRILETQEREQSQQRLRALGIDVYP